MTNLAKIQEQFANHIYDENNLEIAPIINSEKIPVEKRLNIYRNNVFGGFHDALSLTYNITKKIVGEDYFNHLVDKYNQNYISTSGNLEDYGQFFPELIKNLEKKHKLLYLEDIAKFEWLFNLSYLSEDTQNIDLAKLQSLNEEEFMNLNFFLSPSSYLISSKYPIYKIWEMNYNDTDEEINLAEKTGDFILISRPDFKIEVKKLSEIEFNFLKLIQDQKNIYQIYEELSQNDKNFDIGSFVNKFISSRIITKFKI